MKIYTKRGDSGRSGIIGRGDIWKYENIFDVLGTLDELDSYIGYCRSIIKENIINSILKNVQLDIYKANMEIQRIEAGKGIKLYIKREDIKKLEDYIDQFIGRIKIKGFIIPAGSLEATSLHIARAVCRRFERILIRYLKAKGEVASTLIPYFNRLSDLLFALALYMNWSMGIKEEVV